TASGEPVLRLDGHEGAVWAVSWTPDGTRLASASNDRAVRIWDPVSGVLLRRLDGHEGAVTALGWTPDGRCLASASRDRTVRVWDAASGAALRRLDGHEDWVRAVRWLPDGRRLASASRDQTVRVWDSHTGDCLQTLAGVSYDRMLQAWDAAESIQLRRVGLLTRTNVQETVVRSARSGRPLAWYSRPIPLTVCPVSPRLFAGSVSSHVYLLSLEG